jgi:6-phosphogluconolactonase
MNRELRAADDVAQAALELFLEIRPRSVILSGGSTPKAFYERLAGADYPWETVELFFGDERCVPPDHPDSNYRMIHQALLSRVAAKSYPIDGANCDADGYERKLRERFGQHLWFDVGIHGLGPDGHTASLFPGKPELEVSDRLAVHVPQPGLAPWVPRVTLTASTLSAAAVGIFLVSGADKREALERLMRGEDIPAVRIRPWKLFVLADVAAIG